MSFCVRHTAARGSHYLIGMGTLFFPPFLIPPLLPFPPDSTADLCTLSFVSGIMRTLTAFHSLVPKTLPCPNRSQVFPYVEHLHEEGWLSSFLLCSPLPSASVPFHNVLIASEMENGNRITCEQRPRRFLGMQRSKSDCLIFLWTSY